MFGNKLNEGRDRLKKICTVYIILVSGQLEINMSLPDQAIRKAIVNPKDVLTYLKKPVIGQNIITPIYGRYLFDHEWDLAIILDACRYDVAESEIGNHELDIGEPKKIYSAASNNHTHEPIKHDNQRHASREEMLKSLGYM